MPALVAAFLSWLARIVVPLFGMSRLFGFFKSLLTMGLMTVGLPLAINWGAYKVAENFSPQLFDSLGLSQHTIQLTGLAAWIASALQLPFALSVFMGFVAQAYVMRLTQMGGAFAKFNKSRFN